MSQGLEASRSPKAQGRWKVGQWVEGIADRGRGEKILGGIPVDPVDHSAGRQLGILENEAAAPSEKWDQ